jgi:ribosomal protein S18 acetylase RimI-like enzyme
VEKCKEGKPKKDNGTAFAYSCDNRKGTTMSKPTPAVSVTPTLRWMIQGDLPSVLQIQQQLPAPGWTEHDFLAVFQSSDTAGWVAEMEGRVVGFLIYTVLAQPQRVGKKKSKGQSADDKATRHGKNNLRIALLNLAVAARWHRRGIGRALLRRLARNLQQPEDCIQVTVPESNLPMQLLLSDAGFRAVRVLREYFDKEDGYLMQRFGNHPVAEEVPVAATEH